MDVLVADDDDDIRFVVAALLARRGWTITTTCSGEETIEVLREMTFDVLVLDQNMPPGSGTGVIEHLRGLEDVTPVVLFTGYSAMIPPAHDHDPGVVVVQKGDVAALADQVAILGGQD